METMNVSTIEVNGVKYVRADQIAAEAPRGNRAVVVVDRGWIFAGNGNGTGNGNGNGTGNVQLRSRRRPR